MAQKFREKNGQYCGFEQGPIRPPSEAGSLLIRITRNCPWNRCTFCPVYKETKFSLRPVDHVIKDIDQVHRCVKAIKESAGENGKLYPGDIQRLIADSDGLDRTALNSALQWLSGGMRSVFLQDANSLVIRPDRLLTILRHIKHCFPWVDRITSYARSHTIARISGENLRLMAEAGLSRIHIGMESGSDKILKKINKGTDKRTHIKAGRKVKSAGMELSEYIMPGLGGRTLSNEHALESADALNQINPDFIRLRTLAIPNHVELYKKWQSGEFEKLTDVETARELRVFLKALNGITSTIKSDHILNLFEDLQGRYPEDKEKMVAIVDSFLKLGPKKQMLYLVGRRTGMFRTLDDLDDDEKRGHVEKVCSRSGIRPENVDEAVDELMKRFI
ncbi:MAG: radical SAM protein [Desulforhopalus sp.]